MTDRTDTGSGRRRAASAPSGRPSPLTILTAVIPLLTIGALALVRPADPVPAVHPPTTADLARSTLVCPDAVPGSERVLLAHAAGATGEVLLRAGGKDRPLPMTGGTLRRRAPQPVSVTAEADLAAGLTATRAGGGRIAACAQPAPEHWFTGVGAAAEHSSILSLVNPDRGPAVADVTVLGPEGVVDVPALRGVRILGGRAATFDLSEVAPSREALALHVTTTRGRLGASVVDVVDSLGRGPTTRDWLPSQSTPTETSYVVGLGGRPGDRTLTVANPGDAQARVGLRLVTGESEFAPASFEELQIAPQSVVEVDVARLLRGREGQGARALRLDATAPVTAALRTVAGRDLSVAVAGSELASRAAVVLPTGGKRLVVAGATKPGVLTWSARDSEGKQIGEERVEIDPGTAARVKLPSRATQLEVVVERTGAVAVVEVGPPGLSVLPLVELVTTAEVPHVRQSL